MTSASIRTGTSLSSSDSTSGSGSFLLESTLQDVAATRRFLPRRDSRCTFLFDATRTFTEPHAPLIVGNIEGEALDMSETAADVVESTSLLVGPKP